MQQYTQAVIDIGSNSLRLMKGFCDADGRWQFSPKELATTQLGREIDKTGSLSPQGIRASLAAMRRWQKTLPDIPVLAVATSAVREAADGTAFMEEIGSRFHWKCRIISGKEEASLSFSGAASLAVQGSYAGVLDIGGGSSETALGMNKALLWSHSYPLGAVRLSSPDGSFRAGEVEKIYERCEAAFLPLPYTPDIWIGVGGTLTSLAAMELLLESYDPQQVHGYLVTADRLRRRIAQLQYMTAEERRHIPGLQPKRADVILAGLYIADAFMRHYSVAAIQISEQDLLEGVFYAL